MTTRVADLFGKYQAPPKKTRQTERGDLLVYFCQIVNAERDGTKYKPLTTSRMAYLLQHLTVGDMYSFKSQLEDCKRRGYNPSKFFWYSIKAKE